MLSFSAYRSHHSPTLRGVWLTTFTRCLAILLFAALIIASTLVPSAFANDYSIIDQGETNSAVETSDKNNPPVSREELRALFDEMLDHSDARSRSDTPSVETDEMSYDQRLLADWEETRASTMIGELLVKLVKATPSYFSEFRTSITSATSPDEGWPGWKIALMLIGILAAGLIAELFITSRLLRQLYRFARDDDKTLPQKLRIILARAVIQLIGIAIMAITIYSLWLALSEPNEYLTLFFFESLFALIQFRLWLILLRNIFSPYRANLRPIQMDQRSAQHLYFWFVLFFAIIEFADVILVYLTATGMAQILISGLLIPYTFALNLIILGQVWLRRDRITNMFVGESLPHFIAPTNETEDAGFRQEKTHHYMRDFLIHAWPFVFTAWLLLLWLLWLYKTFLGLWGDAQFVTISWWITLAFPVADRMFHSLICNIVTIESLQSPTFEHRARRFIRILQTGFRILLVGFAVFMMTKAAGANTDALLENSLLIATLQKLLNFTVIATVAYVVWELFNAIIEKKLPTQEYDLIASLEGDGGGEGASRAETLLPLIRSCVTAVLIVFVLLSSLHSLGIAITPLLAGAGVVGIAIGFGAQKLVQDILSGLFFLIDDAFRRGEYIELEGLRGTVEKISLRSMQLRHHLGAVQTVPYGEIKTISNLSRDWITMKLELRLSYDTDIEAVRKIIKKVGQEMLEHPEYGRHFILPLKSQGVMRVEESALIIRMKFTSKPGEQWVIRREAYRKVRDALSVANIHFAHREVRVLLPNANEEPQENTPDLAKAAAGGAAAAVIAAELAKQDKLDEESDDGGGDDR